MITRMIERIDVAGGTRAGARDAVVEEAPLVLQARGHEVAVVMRTPGADLELVRGLLFAEGVGRDVALRQVDVDVVDADIAEDALVRRALTANAACGVCGRAAIADLERRAREVGVEWRVAASLVTELPAKLRAAQATFELTGGLHAAALVDRAGALVAIREDVGRHNAVDKLVGWALDAGVRFDEHLLVLSGRLGYELAQKAIVAGIPVIAAVSAASTLAIDLCERFRVTAIGFVRDARFNVYAHGWRVK
jgi:FdhD protein